MSCFHTAPDGHMEECLLGALCTNPSWHLPTLEEAAQPHPMLEVAGSIR